MKKGARASRWKEYKLLPNSKRSLSEIATSLIIILLVLVAIGIIWVVTKNIISRTSEQITIDPLTNNIKIDEAKVGLLTANIKLTRTQGNANLTSLQFVFSEGIDFYTYEEKNPQLDELNTKTFKIPLADGINPTTMKIIPIFEKSKGLEVSITPTQDYTSATNNGLVAYYKFEGDAKDSSGNGNDGIANNAIWTNFGKSGGAYIFDDSDDGKVYEINTPINQPFLSQTFSIITWVNGTNYTNFNHYVISKGSSCSYPRMWDLVINKSKVLTLFYGASTGGQDILSSNISFLESKWYSIGLIFNGGDIKLYQDGNLVNNVTKSSNFLSNSVNLKIGGGECPDSDQNVRDFNGTIDEVMIFNYSLSDAEIKQIYNS